MKELKIWLFDKKFVCEICDINRKYHYMTKHKHLKSAISKKIKKSEKVCNENT